MRQAAGRCSRQLTHLLENVKFSDAELACRCTGPDMGRWACTVIVMRSSGLGCCCKQSSETGPTISGKLRMSSWTPVSLSSGTLISFPASTCMQPASAVQASIALQAGRRASSAQTSWSLHVSCVQTALTVAYPEAQSLQPCPI